MAESKSIKCDCKDESQDKIYGIGRRLMNSANGKGAKPNRYKCTVCGKYHDSSSVVKK